MRGRSGRCDSQHRSPDGAKRHPGPLSRISLRSMRATTLPVTRLTLRVRPYLVAPTSVPKGSVMAALSERLNTPISTAELQRRWQAVRGAMQRERIDVLLMQNNNDHMGGYV